MTQICFNETMVVMRLVVFAAFLLSVAGAWAGTLPLERIVLPPGFAIELLARVPNPRGMVLSSGRVLYVGSMSDGRVTAVELNEHWQAGSQHVIARGLTMPAGVAWQDGSLYVSAVDRILRFDGIDRRLGQPPAPVVVTDRLPQASHHGARYLAFGPDGWLYFGVGAPCNICAPDPERYAAIRRLGPGGTLETVARGVRNSVGFDWQPGTGNLWFTDNGRDNLGDDAPPDELNRLDGIDHHFGYPYCHGGTIADPEFGRQQACAAFVPPAYAFPTHVAPLGLRFYNGNQFPASYRGQIFVAEHGSWNRSSKVGYRISLIRLEGNRVVGREAFATGWLQGETAWGRPADLLVLPDGSLLVADDLAGAIYRITYRTEGKTAP